MIAERKILFVFAATRKQQKRFCSVFVASADWSKDRLVGSTVHGVNGNNALMAKYNAAVGKYFSGGFKDNAGLAKDLAAAYEAGTA